MLFGGAMMERCMHSKIVARTVVRRAERLMCELGENESVNPEAVKYANRLSDHLFVLARHVNDGGKKDVLWQPGANR